MSMEKYGVAQELSERMEKYASTGCPNCGCSVTTHGRLLACPNCGTEPFEEDNRNGNFKQGKG